MAKWQGHSLLGRRAVEVLPEWEKTLLHGDMSEHELTRAVMPESVTTPVEKLAAYCHILDWVYEKDFTKYCLLPDGRWIPHTLPDASFQASTTAGTPISLVASAELIKTLLQKVVDLIASHEGEELLRHAGVLGHFLEEPFTPGHALNNSLFPYLFPDPDPNRHLHLHEFFDAATDRFDPLPPKLMGTTVNEAVFHLLDVMMHGMYEGLALIPHIIEVAYAGKEGKGIEYCKELLAGQSRMASFVTASAWHTAFCIAMGRFEPSEVEALKNVKLSSVSNYYIHPSVYGSVIPGCLVENSMKKPIRVRDASGKEIIPYDAFGMFGHAGIKYYIGEEVFSKFRCSVALPVNLTEGQDEHTNVIFSIEGDDKENTVYSEDIEYRSKRLLEVPLLPGECLKEISIKLPRDVRTLIIAARSFPYTGKNGETTFSIPHIAVCNAELVRK